MCLGDSHQAYCATRVVVVPSFSMQQGQIEAKGLVFFLELGCS